MQLSYVCSVVQEPLASAPSSAGGAALAEVRDIAERNLVEALDRSCPVGCWRVNCASNDRQSDCRCFDPESGTVAKDSNVVYGLMAALALVLALLSAAIWRRLRTRSSSGS